MSGILESVSGITGRLKLKAQGVLDNFFPPEKRAEVISKLQTFAVSNPKLSAFLLTNIALTGFPLVMFAVFTLTIFVFSLIVALLIGLIAALLFTVFMVGVALICVLPTVFMTTMAASFVFLWGLGGYYIIKWFNQGQDGATPEGDAIGDKLNNLTGGKLSFIMDGARKKDDTEKDNATGTGEPMGPPNLSDAAGTATGAANGVKKQTEGVKQRTDTASGGVMKPVGNTAGTVKGVSSGATGLG